MLFRSSIERQIKSAKNLLINGITYGKVSKNGENHTHNHNADEVFEVWGAETLNSYKAEELKKIMKKIENDKAYGSVLRGKGIVQSDNKKWLQFDYVPGEIEVKSIIPDYAGRLCLIGKNLDKNKLCNLFNITV